MIRIDLELEIQLSALVISGKEFPGVDFGTASGKGYVIGSTPATEYARVDESGYPAHLIGVKYYHHPKDDSAKERPADPFVRMTVLLNPNGKWKQRLWSERTGDEVEVLLQEPGDFIIWTPGLRHEWQAIEDSTMLTVTWHRSSVDIPTLTVVVGLPGSGKSHLIRRIQETVSGPCIEDFHKDAINNSPRIVDSKHFHEVIQAMRQGKSCAIADIAFCDTERRCQLEQTFRSIFPTLKMAWIFFENDVAHCIANIRARARPRAEDEIRKAKELSNIYVIPHAASVVKVWQPQ